MTTLTNVQRCFASKTSGTVIDILRPETGLTWHFAETLEQCREEWPDAEEMTLDEFCEWKAQQQQTPIEWTETTEERYFEMLETLPPAFWVGTYFLVGEPSDHCAATGRPRYTAFRKVGDRFEECSRPLTIAEMRKLI